MLNLETQQRARETLRKVDQSLQAMVALEDEVRKQADTFREHLFNAFQFVESESMTLQELQVQIRREGKQQLQVGSRGRQPFMLVLDPEIAYDSKPHPQPAEGAPHSTMELGARLFAVFTPPSQGLLRYYTIFADGAWKRTTFVLTADGPQPRSALVARAAPDVLVLEAIDLISYAVQAHSSWAALAADAETLTLNDLQNRALVKSHLSGLGAPRRS